MKGQIHLRQFSPSELIFNEEETRVILGFFFKDHRQAVAKLRVTDDVRNFSQGLLVRAVDATYAVGFVQALFEATANPGAGVKKIFIKFGKRAVRHWFEHATADDLREVKIYDSIRSDLAYIFGRVFGLYVNGVAVRAPHTALVASNRATPGGLVWG